MNVSSSQIKLATKLHKHNVANATRNPMKTIIDLPLSTEMIELLEKSLNKSDDDGYLSEAVGSHLSHPLSAMSVYCPAAAIMSSKFSAARIPSPPHKGFMNSVKENGSLTFRSDSYDQPGQIVISEKQTSPTTHGGDSMLDGIRVDLSSPPRKTPPLRPKIDEARSRLDVLWLRRKAELAREDGDLSGAVDIIQEALDVHLGGRDYNNNTNLSRPVLSSDPRELLNTINKDFFMFDTFAHSKAAVVQRWYHRKHTARCSKITLITKTFRGYLKRKVYNKYKEVRRQCAVLVQRRFRVHLIRMHALATKIKQWYKLRKDVQAYQKKLRLYRMARRIQALFRGYIGRKRAGLKRLQFLLVGRIQRTARAFIVRRNRAWVLSLFHQRFWLAARRIQTFVRKQQAVVRSQLKLLIELSRESIRARKERIVVEEALRMQKIRNQYYFGTDAGRIHLQHVQRRTHVKALSIKAAQKALSEEEVLTQRLISILEEHDTEGTGNISTRRLKKVLNRALIPVDKEQLMVLKQFFDPEETGQIGFSDIIDWYHSEAADDLVEPDELSDRLSQMKLSLQRKLRGLHLKTALHGARKVLNAEQAAWLSKETIGTFRMTHPPKYQCCQCRQAFVLFTDYYVHFHPESGNCGVLQQKGLFFPRYWVQADWLRQRQLEQEVMRVNDELPYVLSQCTMQNCAHVVHSAYKDVKKATKEMVHKATDLIRLELSTVKKAHLKKYTVQNIRELFSACECSSACVFAAEAVVKALRLPVSKAWISDGLCPQNDMAKWLSKYLADYAESDHSSFSDNSSSTKLSDYFKSDDPKTSKHHVAFSLSKLRVPTVTDSGLMKRRARDLGLAQVSFLKALHVDTQTALFALLEFRSRKPRRIAMSDEELRELGLISLTEEHYLTLQRELVARLHRINALYVKICSHQPTPKCPTLRRLLMFRTPPPVGPSEEITGDGLFKLFIEDAHGVAAARLQSYLRSSLGGLVRRRLAEDLKISKHRLLLSLVQDPTKSSKYADATSAKIEENMSLYGADKASALKTLDVHFLFGKYCSIYQDEGIDVRDFDLICKEFSMHTKAVHAYLALSQLDPEDAGFIYFVNFLRFMRGVMYESLSHDLLMGIRQSTLRLLQESTRSRYFFHAADALMARFRSVQRMEVTVREGILYSGDFRFELYLHTLQVFYRRCEGGDVADDLNARKYHIMSQSTKRGGDAMLDGEDDYDDDGGESREGQEESLGTLGHNSLLETQVQSSPALSPTAYTDTAAPAPNTGESEGGDGNAARSPHAVASADVGAEPEEEEEEEIVGFQADNEEEEEPKDQESVAPPTADFVKPAIAGSVYDNLTKWYTLRWREEESEHRVIYSVVEQRAERQYWQNLLTPVGWYNLWTERQFLQQLDSMVDAAGYCIAHKWTKIPPAVAKDGRSAPIATMQQALSVVGAASSVSSLASESLLQRSAAASFTSMVEVEGRNPRGGAHYDNASTSTHTHSLAEDGDEEHPFAYLDLPSRAHWPDSISTVQRTDPSVSGDPAQRSVASGSLGGCPEPLNSPDRGSMHDINAEAAGRGAEVGQESDGFLKFTTQRSVLLEEEAAALSTHGRALYSALLEMAVSVFDTDCTGDLDEGEMRALLRCLRCGLSEKAFRHAFADNDDVIRGVSLRKLVTHLSERVQWDHRERWKALTGKRRAGVGITKRPNIDCAAGLLVSLQRQLAHKRALQSVKLSKIGRIVMLRESHAGTSERTLLVRSQLFAMRQVYMFLRTTQGRIKLHHAKHDVAYSWQREVVGVPSHHPVAASGVRYLNYAYYLHQEAGDGGVLATEIPHVVKFLVARLQLVPTRKVEELALMFTGIRAQTDIRSLNQAEFTALLAPLFEQPKLVDPSGSYWSRLLGLQSSRIRKDAKLRMLSCARQQAVKIAMDFPVIEVGETNYRCSVLGLHLFMKRSLLSQSKSKSGSKAASSISTSTAYSTPALGIPEEPTGSDPAVVAELSTGTEPSALATAHPTKASATATVPKEAVALHLLSLGYSAADLSHSCLADLVDVEHLHGHMQLDPVSLAAATEAARTFIAKTGTYLEAARRLRRKLVNNWRLHAEFKHVARALTQYPEVVDKKGGEFLKEILVGVSHCVDK